MEIIAELEPTARGPYCGSLGYIGFDGAMDTNILIRTFTAGRGWVQFPVGGGIVADSDPAREYEETLHKAAGLLRALCQGEPSASDAVGSPRAQHSARAHDHDPRRPRHDARTPTARPHLAPMGPRVDARTSAAFLLRPFPTSQTYRNLPAPRRRRAARHRRRAAAGPGRGRAGRPAAGRACRPTQVRGFVLTRRLPVLRVPRPVARRVAASACGSRPRWSTPARCRDFFGFNRAKHAVVEAAILATRLHLLPRGRDRGGVPQAARARRQDRRAGRARGVRLPDRPRRTGPGGGRDA